MSAILPIEHLAGFQCRNAEPVFDEWEDILTEMDQLMAEYVDPREVDAWHVPKTVNLVLEDHLKSISSVEAPSELKNLWTSIVDNGRLILTAISIILSSLVIGLTAPFAVSILGATLYVISTTSLLAGIGSLGVLWAFHGYSEDQVIRLETLQQLRNRHIISQAECWNFRKELSNKWNSRELLIQLVGRLLYQNEISIKEHEALIRDLNQGTWNVIRNVLEFINLRTELNSAMKIQTGSRCSWNQASLQFAQELIDLLVREGDWEACLGRSSNQLREILDLNTLFIWMQSFQRQIEVNNDLYIIITRAMTSLIESGFTEFKEVLEEFIRALELSTIDNGFLPNEHKQGLQRLLRENCFSLKQLAKCMSRWKELHQWYLPIEQLVSCLNENVVIDDPARSKAKVDAFAKGFLGYLLEQFQLKGISSNEAQQCFELFFGKWWNQAIFQLIQKVKHTDEISIESLVKSDSAQGISPRKETPILIFKSPGGGGHESAGNGAKAILETESKKASCTRDYKVELINAHQEIFIDFDPIKKVCGLFCNPRTGEDFYNDLLQGGWSKTADLLIQSGVRYFASHRKQLEHAFEKYLDARIAAGHSKPKLIISNMPAIDLIIAAVCERREIPFLITTTDLDTAHYVYGLDYPQNKPGMLKYGVSFPDYSIYSRIKSVNFMPEQIEITGFPVKPAFLQSRDRTPFGIEQAKKNLAVAIEEGANLEEPIYIPPGKKTIVLSMGAQGSQLVFSYLDKLVSMEDDYHVVVLCGRNPDFKAEVEIRYGSHLFNPNGGLSEGITLSAVSFSSRVPEIMAASHLFIGKPGPTTTLEAVYTHLPALLDNTTPPMSHETENIRFVKKYGLGNSVDDLNNLPSLVSHYLSGNCEGIPQELIFQKQQSAVIRDRRFSQIFPLLVEHMLQSSERLAISNRVEMALVQANVNAVEQEEDPYLNRMMANQEAIRASLHTSLQEIAPKELMLNLDELLLRIFEILNNLSLKERISASPALRSTLILEITAKKCVTSKQAWEMVENYLQSNLSISTVPQEMLDFIDPFAHGLKASKEILCHLIASEMMPRVL